MYSIQYYNDASLLHQGSGWTAHSDAVAWCQDDFPGNLIRNATAPMPAPKPADRATIFAENPGLPVLPVAGPLHQRVASVVSAVDPHRRR